MKIKLFVALEIQYIELRILSFNPYFYYVTRGFIASICAFFILTRTFILLTHTFNPPACDVSLVTRRFELATRGFELVTRGFELVTPGFELVTRNFHFTFAQFNRSSTLFFL